MKKNKKQRKLVEYIERAPEEIEQDYRDHLDSLIVMVQQYDLGRKHFAAEIAINLRTLLYDKPNPSNPNTESRSILSQVNLMETKFVDTTFSVTRAVPKRYLEPAGALVLPRGYVENGRHYLDWIPSLERLVWNDPYLLDFDKWWNRTLLFSGEVKFSRLKIVRDMANQDRGAHRGATFTKDYFTLSRSESQKFSMSMVPGAAATNPSLFINNPARVDFCQSGAALRYTRGIIRQIAHEVLITLLPDACKKNYLDLLPIQDEGKVPDVIVEVQYIEDVYG